MPCGFGRRQIEAWVRDYDNIQWLAVRLIHAQIACSLIGSLGALYNGVLLANLGISLFALIAIESSSQTLARTYAILLLSSIVLDVAWLLLFSRDIWYYPSETYGTYVTFSAKLTLTMQIIGFVVRLSSSLLWIQMYKLGVSGSDNPISHDTDIYLRNSFLSPSIVRRSSGSDDVIGGSIYDPSRYSSLLEDGQDDTYLHGVCQSHGISVADSVSASETSHLNSPMAKTCDAKDDENVVGKLQIVDQEFSILSVCPLSTQLLCL